MLNPLRTFPSYQRALVFISLGLFMVTSATMTSSLASCFIHPLTFACIMRLILPAIGFVLIAKAVSSVIGLGPKLIVDANGISFHGFLGLKTQRYSWADLGPVEVVGGNYLFWKDYCLIASHSEATLEQHPNRLNSILFIPLALMAENRTLHTANHLARSCEDMRREFSTTASSTISVSEAARILRRRKASEVAAQVFVVAFLVTMIAI